ncbi:hypothetical protein PHMEG_0002480 [Phytophthora megakarya]|uniref:Uncharacterized protein n=1 Tax=Phytophthora megakarya TaxID=4795 RepID=A0A225WZ11_9STRA|nr:hypothetical protein PHMEG_0002480 [Phytophthora megakarya]
MQCMCLSPTTVLRRKPIASISDADIIGGVMHRCKTMDLSIDDCDERVSHYYEAFNRIVENNGLQDLIRNDKDDDPANKCRMKFRCHILINPFNRRSSSHISRLIDFESRDANLMILDSLIGYYNIRSCNSGSIRFRKIIILKPISNR